MNTFRPRRAVRRRDACRKPALGALALVGALVSGGCATGGGTDLEPAEASDGPSEAMLQRVANSALPGGNAVVHFVDGVAYVTGNVATAIDANAVVRALRQVDGVDRVESGLRRGM